MLREEEWRREMAKKMVETLEENVKEAKEEKTTEKIRATKPQFTEEQIKAGYSTYVTFKNAA